MPTMNRTILFLSLGFLLFLTACSRTTSTNTPSAPVPKNISTADLSRLRWIEGSWRGTGDIDKPFYERYKFENDTTLVIEHLADETFNTVTETSRYELKDGRFGNGSGRARWVATAMDDKSITFEPVANATNSFRWERESDNTWKATLNWQSADNATSTRVYRMERWPPPAGK
jgi:hypothetical protein